MTGPDIALALGKAIAPTTANFAKKVGHQKYDEFVAIYTNAFNDFLRLTQEKCSQVKTLLNQEAAVNLKDIYVNVRLLYQGENDFKDTQVLENLKTGSHRIAITGLAGSGKSMLMRWVALSLVESLLNHQRIPLFVEIRDLDLGDSGKIVLDELLFEYCTTPLSRRNLNQFRIGLKEGIFVIILDGVDEVPPERIAAFLKALTKFADTYGNSCIIASARPGTQLTQLPRFLVYKVQPLDLPKVIEVLERAPYDDKRKSILINSLKKGLYQTHRSFLSNPLLVTITLITFDDASRIPDNLTGFYSAAFDALFTRHDWSKGVFTRKRYSSLEKSDFERIFQYFCYQSYFRANYTFSRAEVLDLIEKSADLSGIRVDPDAYLKDCVLSVCLLLVEEPKITFVHRSFQEFFTARFVAGYLGDKAFALLDWLASRNSVDNTFVMAAQLNRELVIRHWGLPRAREVRDLFVAWLNQNEPTEILEYAGLKQIGCNLRSGEVVSFSGRESPGWGTLRAIFMLSQVEAISDLAFHYTANAYGGSQFGDLDRKLQSLIRKLTDSRQIVQVDVEKLPASPEAQDIITALAKGQLDTLVQAIDSLEEYIESRDRVADLVSLATPGRR